MRLEGGVRSASGSLRVLATFAPWRGSVYRIVGVSISMRSHEPLFVNVARSFRPMTQELLADVQVESREIWLSGQVSPRARREIEARGITVVERVLEMMIPSLAGQSTQPRRTP